MVNSTILNQLDVQTPTAEVNPRWFRLVEAPIGARVWIRSIEGAPGFMAKLNQFGLFPGDLAKVKRIAPFGGPVLLEVGGMEIALGKSLAGCVFVEGVCDLP